MRKGAVVLLVLVALLLAGAVALPSLLGGRLLERQLAAAVREATGGELRVEGGLRVWLLPDVGFAAEGVRVAGADGSELASLASASGRVRLLPLLGGRVVVEELAVRRPELHLQLAADGTANWRPAGSGGTEVPLPETPSEAEPGGLPLRDLTLAGVRVEDGAASFRDAASGWGLDAREIELALDLPDLSRPLALSGSLLLNGEAVTLGLTAAEPAALLAGELGPLAAELKAAPLRLGYDGALQQRPVAGLDGRLELEAPSVGRLLAWLGWPLAPGQPDPGPVQAGLVLAANGPRLGLQQASVTGKALELKATGSLDASAPVSRFEADVEVVRADLDAYLPSPAAGQPAGGGADQAPGGWSEEPIELSALRQAEGEARLRVGELRYRGLPLRDGRAALALSDGSLALTLERLGVAGGNVAAAATLDAGQPTPAFTGELTVGGVGARPLLHALAGTDRLSGTMAFEAKAEAQGANPKALVAALDGSGRFRVADGAIHGVNLAAALRQARNLRWDPAGGEAQKTDFAELGGSFAVADGILENRDLELRAPLLRATGGGRVDLPARALDYQVVARLVGTLEGQGSRGDPLLGLPIPIRVVGPWDSPSVGVDWEGVLREAAKDPARLARMPGELRALGKELGVDLPLPEGPAAEALGRALQGAPDAAGVLRGLGRGLLGDR